MADSSKANCTLSALDGAVSSDKSLDLLMERGLEEALSSHGDLGFAGRSGQEQDGRVESICSKKSSWEEESKWELGS